MTPLRTLRNRVAAMDTRADVQAEPLDGPA
jgi:hypothetical protein